MKYFFVLALFFGNWNSAHAWEQRGHHLICRLASRLVDPPVLQDFLKGRGDLLGHLCNIPDIYWKDLDPERKYLYAHYIEPDIVGLSTQEIPSEAPAAYALYLKKLAATQPPSTSPTVPLSREEFFKQMGINWWRAEALFKVAVDSGKKAKSLPAANPLNQFKDELPYNQAVYAMLLNMGLMGHFVGDNAQPYHNISDYDGYAKGRGGIHSFYEGSCVNQLSIEAEVKIFHLAQTTKRKIKGQLGSSVPEFLRISSLSALKDLPQVEKRDRVIQASSRAGGLKIPAQRKAPGEACPPFYPFIEKELALATASLALLWEKIFQEAGEPPLQSYKSFRYPIEPEFVPLPSL